MKSKGFHKDTFGKPVFISLLTLLFLAPLTPLSAEDRISLTILYTGSQIGYLEPCGCSRPQLGGLPRRDSLIKTIRKEEKTLLIIDNGDIGGGFGRQEELKYETSLLSLNEMGYTAANLGEGDLFLGIDYLTYLNQVAQFPLLSANLFSLKTKKNIFESYLIKTYHQGDIAIKIGIIGLLGKDFEAQVKNIDEDLTLKKPIEVLKTLLPEVEKQSDLILLLAHLNQKQAGKLAKDFPSLDIIVYGHDREEPLEEPVRIGQAILLNSGTKGKYIGKLTLILDREGKIVRQKHQMIDLSPDLPDSPIISSLLSMYQDILKEENLLAKVPRRPAPGGSYLGSNSCKSCHLKETLKWKKSRHARAYSTLVERGYQFDPQCIGCHVTGFGYLSGFENPQTTPDLANVGCESCHGTSSRHIKEPRKRYGLAEKTTCGNCHDSDRSPQFDYQEYLSKIQH